MDKLPPDFRAQYEYLRTIIDPISQKSVSEYLGSPYWGLETYPTGARRFNFENGDIASYDHTNRYPIVCVYGPIFKFYSDIGGPTQSVLGRPLTDVRDLPDGSRCAVFEGGHIHQWGDKAEPFPASHCTASYQPPPPPFPFGIGPNKLPLSFLQKWTDMSYQRDSISQISIAQRLGPIYYEPENIEAGGQVVKFQSGAIVIFDNIAAVVYNPISSFWTGVNGGWGRPLADEQDLGDGGRCQVFEGGHIHRYGDEARPVRAEMCTARYRPTPRPGVSFNKMNPLFQWKWSELLYVNLPTMQPVALALGDLYGPLQDFTSGKAGQYCSFGSGVLITLSSNPAPPAPNTPLELMQPFAVYGDIHRFWNDAGADTSMYGRPLCDEQGLPDGGRCSIFEGGHIHWYNGVARDFPARDCTARYKPQPPPTRPSVPSIPVTAPSFQPQSFFTPSAQAGPPPTQSYPPPSSQQSYSPAPQSSSSPSFSMPPVGTMVSSASHVAHTFQHHMSSHQQPSPQPQMTTDFQPQQQQQQPMGTPFDFGQQFNPGGGDGSSPAPFVVNDPNDPNNDPNANMTSSDLKPVGIIALLIFGLIGWNIEKDCDCCCCCC